MFEHFIYNHKNNKQLFGNCIVLLIYMLQMKKEAASASQNRFRSFMSSSQLFALESTQFPMQSLYRLGVQFQEQKFKINTKQDF